MAGGLAAPPADVARADRSEALSGGLLEELQVFLGVELTTERRRVDERESRLAALPSRTQHPGQIVGQLHPGIEEEVGCQVGPEPVAAHLGEVEIGGHPGIELVLAREQPKPRLRRAPGDGHRMLLGQRVRRELFCSWNIHRSRGFHSVVNSSNRNVRASV